MGTAVKLQAKSCQSLFEPASDRWWYLPYVHDYDFRTGHPDQVGRTEKISTKIPEEVVQPMNAGVEPNRFVKAQWNPFQKRKYKIHMGRTGISSHINQIYSYGK